MQLSPETILVGLIAGYASGHLGIGGGIITKPAIRLMLGYSALIAVGTPLLVNIPTALSGAYIYYKNDLIDKRMAFVMMAPAALGAILGSYLTSFFNGSLILLLSAIVIFFLGARLPLNLKIKKAQSFSSPYLMVIALFIGSAAGFLGLGGGFLLVPFLSLVIGHEMKLAFGTSLTIILAITIPGAVIHSMLGHIDLPLAINLIIGVIPGAIIGARIAISLSEKYLKILFGTLLMVLASYLGYFELIRLVR